MVMLIYMNSARPHLKFRRSAGFTIVEIIIVVAIILILTSIAVVNLGSTQATGRDVEREEDIKAIALQYETYYNDRHFNPGPDPAPSYPHTTESAALTGLDPEAYHAPSTTAGVSALTNATNAVETTSGVTPQPTINQYVYQPLNEANAICTSSNGPCVKFNMFWRSEITNTVKKITSRNQQ